jgi:PPP family 3-phenylpropionic acid transporter
VFSTALLPVADGITVVAARARHIDYGRVRLWGSTAFIVVATASGRLLGVADDAVILWLVLGALALVCVASTALPDLRAPARASLSGWRALPRAFWICAAAASLIQASHSVYYGFSTLQWRSVGLSDTTIGLLWGEGVVAEIVLFAASARLPLGPRAMLLLAAAGGIVRWIVLGTTDALPALAAAQLLHGASFGAAHLAMARYILREVAPELTATAQGLSAAVGSLGTASFLAVAGMLYAGWGSGAYFAMTALALLGGATAFFTPRPSTPSRPSPSPASASGTRG